MKTHKLNDDRAAIAQAFAAALFSDFEKHGVQANADLRAEKLDVYLRLAAAIDLPADGPQSVTQSMSDEEVLRIIDLLDRWDAAQARTPVETPQPKPPPNQRRHDSE